MYEKYLSGSRYGKWNALFTIPGPRSSGSTVQVARQHASKDTTVFVISITLCV